MLETFKHTEIHVMVVPGKVKEKSRKIFKEIMAENSHHLLKNMYLHIQEVQRPPSRIDGK